MNLRCCNISKRFGEVGVLNRVSFTAFGGEVVAVVGPNGAGKTTLLNVIAGALQADSGQCFFNDRQILGLAAHEIANAGIRRTFQDLRTPASLTCLDVIKLSLHLPSSESFLGAVAGLGRKEERAAERIGVSWLVRLGLQDHGNSAVGTLSYGQQKLVSLASCIASEPLVLLLDEPIAGLQPEAVDLMCEIMQEIKAQEKLIVLIEHDLALVRRIADKVVVMDEGRVIADGPSSYILGLPHVLKAYIG